MTAEQPRTWRLDLPFVKPMSLNHRAHWRVKAQETRAFRTAACLLARQAHIPALGRAQIELHYAPRDRRRRDAVNLAPTLKACEDGIVDAGVIPDDTPAYSVPMMPIIEPPTGKTGALWLIIREVAL